MPSVTKELDILKQLFENLSDTDKQAFLTSVSQKEAVLLDFIRKTMCTIKSVDVAKRPAIPV